jgi:energy-coupling factor transporter ATP-binding protein EcfA2
VDRFRAKASKAKQAQSRLKMLEKMDVLSKIPNQTRFEFHMPAAENCPNPVAHFKDGFLGYGDKSILKNLTLQIGPKDRIGLLGANGAGKSTLIKLMESALSIYVFKAKKDLFSEGFSKGHKFFAQTKNKRIVFFEEQDKKKVDADLMKDVVDGNKMNNEVLFATTEKIDINFKLLFFSNNLMNFDADSGIKRRLIHFEFKNKFVDKEELEKEKAKHTIGNVFEVDRTLLTKFNENDDYKNALIHVLISKAREYFEKGLTVPRKYIEIANDVCEDNDKFKMFFDNHFDITNNENDRTSKDEIHEMFNRYSKCNFSATSVMTDIKRLQLNYQRLLCCMYNGTSRRGVVIGIKHKTNEESEPEVQAPQVSDLDHGLDPIMNYEHEYNKLKAEHEKMRLEHEKMRLEFEAFKKLHEPKKVVEAEAEADVDDDEFEALIENAPTVQLKSSTKSTEKKMKTKL